jgi:hypothetical protein
MFFNSTSQRYYCEFRIASTLSVLALLISKSDTIIIQTQLVNSNFS